MHTYIHTYILAHAYKCAYLQTCTHANIPTNIHAHTPNTRKEHCFSSQLLFPFLLLSRSRTHTHTNTHTLKRPQVRITGGCGEAD